MTKARVKLLASAGFFAGYLFVQAGYPALSWFDVRFHRFAWHMYTGRSTPKLFLVVHEDGSTRELPGFFERDAPVRLYGSAVDRVRFVPPHICSRWPDAREVRVRYIASGRERVWPCR